MCVPVCVCVCVRARALAQVAVVEEAKQTYVKTIENSEGDVTPPPGLRKRQATQGTTVTRRFRQLRQQRLNRQLDPTDDQRPDEKENFEASDGPKGRKATSGDMGMGMMKAM